MTATRTLIDFVRARLDEDEQTARAATADTTGRWTLLDSTYGVGQIVQDDCGALIVPARWAEDAQMRHAARNDPARVLRAVEAKRLLIEPHVPHDYDGGTGCGHCGWPTNPQAPDADIDSWPCRQIRAVASEWSDHPEYRQEWRP